LETEELAKCPNGKLTQNISKAYNTSVGSGNDVGCWPHLPFETIERVAFLHLAVPKIQELL
jgi:hypothetical protein